MNEQIQMQADTLYHQMLDQEKAIETAKAEGKPIPEFPALLKAQMAKKQSPGENEKRQIEISDLHPRLQNEAMKKLDKLEGTKREIEEMVLRAEINAGVQVSEKVQELEREQEAERKKRKEQGRETMADRMYYAFRAK